MARLVYSEIFLVEVVPTQEKLIAQDFIGVDVGHIWMQNNTSTDVNVLLFQDTSQATPPIEIAIRAGGYYSLPFPVQSFAVYSAQTEPPVTAVPPAGAGGTYNGPDAAPPAATGYLSVLAFDDVVPISSGGEPVTASASLGGSLPAGANHIGSVTVDTALPAGANNIGNVGIAGALPAGANNIGDVGIAGALPAGANDIGNVGIVGALPAGANNIGHVDVDTLPALPAGANDIGNVGIVGALPAGTNEIGSVDQSGWTWAKVTAAAAGVQNVKGTPGKVAQLVVDSGSAGVTITLQDGASQAWNQGNYNGPFPISCLTSIQVNFSAAGDAWILYK